MKSVSCNASSETASWKAEVMRYLERAPQAADTIDGIVDWWLHLQRLRTARAAVSAAVDELVTEGRLARIEHPDGTVLYALPRRSPP